MSSSPAFGCKQRKLSKLKLALLHRLEPHQVVQKGSRGARARQPFFGGQIEVRWDLESRDKQQWLVFEWEESRVSNAVALARKGFGTELIAQRVPYELRGKGALQRGKDGMTAQIEFPLLRSNSILETSMSERSQ